MFGAVVSASFTLILIYLLLNSKGADKMLGGLADFYVKIVKVLQGR